MSLVYISGDAHYTLSYKELKEQYDSFTLMTNKEFLNNLPNAIHFACIVSYLKELPNNLTLSDSGIVHELVHLLPDDPDPIHDVDEIRFKFNELLKLI